MKKINGMSTDEYARHEIRQAKIQTIKALAATSDTEKKAAAEAAEKHAERSKRLLHIKELESRVWPRRGSVTSYKWNF